MKMIEKGISAVIQHKVTEKETAAVVKSGSLPVLATPVLSALMEEAACKALAPYLKENETTVGGFIALTHKAPTLPGHIVTVTATVTTAEKKKISFIITASDEGGEIGNASHDRFLVDAKKFMTRAEGKYEK